MLTNWYRDYTKVIDTLETMTRFLKASHNDTSHILKFQNARVEDAELKDRMYNHCADLGLMLHDLDDLVKRINGNHRTPDTAILKNDNFLFKYQSVWEKQLSGTVVDSSAMVSEFSSVIEFMKSQKKLFLDDHDSGHSSYSDYSETETDSEEDDYSRNKKKLSID